MSTVAVRAFYHSPTTNVRLMDLLTHSWDGFVWYGPGTDKYDEASDAGELTGDVLRHWRDDTKYHPEKGYAYVKSLDKVVYISNKKWVIWNEDHMTDDDRACSKKIKYPRLESFFPANCLYNLERMGFIGPRLEIPARFIR